MTLYRILKYGIALALVVLIVSVIAGCSRDSAATGLSGPFNNSMSFFTLKGYAAGFAPGETYSFDLALNNPEKEIWQSKFSVYLIDKKGVVLNIVSQRPFTLQPESSMGSNFDMTLPGDIQKGAYGLMLVFPGRGTSITTIHIGAEATPQGAPARTGDSPLPTAGPWPDLKQLPQF